MANVRKKYIYTITTGKMRCYVVILQSICYNISNYNILRCIRMNTVTVKINGVEYNLKGKEDDEYLLKVAAYVDSKFKEISVNNNKLSLSSVAVLSALNIAMNYLR